MKFVRKYFNLALLFIVCCSMINSNKGLINLNKQSPRQDWGGGNLYFLDRQNVSCPAKTAIDGFRLIRPSGNTLAYSYSCRMKCSGLKTGQTYNASTQLNDVDRNINHSANFLDRHYVTCRDGYALQSFQLRTVGGKIKYDYTCTAALCKARKTMFTNWESGGRNEVIYLDRQTIRMQNHNVITGFKLETHYRGGSHFRYKVDYCELKHPPKVNKAPIIPQKPKIQHVKPIGGSGSIPPQFRKPTISILTPQKPIMATAPQFKRKPIGGPGSKTDFRNVGGRSSIVLPPQPKKFSEIKIGGRGSIPPQFRKPTIPIITPQKPIMVGGPGSIPPQFRNIKNPKPKGGPDSIPPQFRKPIGGPDSIPPQFRNNQRVTSNNAGSATSNGSINSAPLNPSQIAANSKGKQFCSTHCDSNPAANTKKCLENNQLIPCKRCTNKPTQSDPQVREVCGLVCNALLLPNSSCDFYGYLNNSKKVHNIALLNKFGLQILRKFFKR